MKSRSMMAVRVASIILMLAGSVGCTPNAIATLTPIVVTAAVSPTPVSITINYNVPSELNPDGGGAPNATMQQAAAFAWQEFIALSWPAATKTKDGASQRDTPDTNCKFGDPNCVAAPLVWQTFRGKVEIFPGQGNPAGYDPSAPSYGYDTAPNYIYGGAFGTTGQVAACDTPSTDTAWVNLDETDQITLDSMFAGAAPTSAPGNSAPQLIRFMAKANRTEYNYVAKNIWFGGVNPTVKTNTLNYLATQQASPPAGSSDLVSLPAGTIEMKAGWRLLNETEAKSGRFTMTTVRYYEANANPSLPTCYHQETFGLVALHIIQKTPTAPYFIYATFEQADNILTTDGKPVEDEEGNVIALPNCPASQTAPCPTTPNVTLNDSPNAATPAYVSVVPPSAPYCTPSTSTPPINQLYYLNASPDLKPALPSGGFICINYRDNLIPPPVIEANQTAHTAIRTYNQANDIPDSPWLYYKLVNVQYAPINKDYAGLYTGDDPNSGQNPSSYHLSNIVVETNRPLQLFSGGLLPSGTNSDYESQVMGSGSSTTIHTNMYYNGSQQNMGGCMGCHGSQGQHQGGDFSVILANGRVRFPQVPTVSATPTAVP